MIPAGLPRDGASTTASVEDAFLSWFVDQGTPMLETRLRLGGVEYFHFSSFFQLADGRAVASFGSALSRKAAALKCAGEAIERKAMAKFFVGNKVLFPKAVRNSNGWAAHTSRAQAEERAQGEALERHLLLKSFLKFGWAGFNPVHTIEAGDIRLKLMVSRFTAGGKIAGIVAAQSTKFPGASFGYTQGLIGEMDNASFWQSAIFEAANKFLLLEKREPGATDEKSWLHREVNHFIYSPFDMGVFSGVGHEVIETDLGDTRIHHTDLSQELGFSLHAVFAFGGNLIPLYCKSELGEDGARYLQPILERNGIGEIPERHPIL